MFDKATSTNAMAAKKGEAHMPSLRNVTRPDSWIRGVNIGGWLVLERWITPYLFALTNCHLDGEFCRYPQQVLNHKGVPLPECDLKKCLPISTDNVDGGRYPMDEYTLTDAFPDKGTARRYLEHHWDTFVTKQDIQLLRQAGLTHVRVPLGYWILGDVWEGEPYVDGGWPFFRRLVEWCREEGLEVWPDLHAAPGSQNGFDNSGRALPDSTSINWYNSTENVQRTLDVIEHISLRVLEDGLDDVVTGFGILNEVFKDADLDILRKFTNKAFDIVRSVLGNETAVYTGDSFRPEAWNDGWWLDQTRYKNTYLDNHVYHVFFEQGRHLSPRQHIAYVCAHTEDHHSRSTNCCFEDHPKNTIPSKGIGTIVGEWSASFDSLPKTLLADIMEGIALNGTAPMFHRALPLSRQAFMRNFVEAQMVAYEAASLGISRGWFFWNFKMEGGAYAEWDFLRGIQEGWIPMLPPPEVASEQIYGTCEDILFRTDDNYTLIHETPDPSTLDWTKWQGWDLDDDVVKTHGESLLPDYRPPHEYRNYGMYAVFVVLSALIVFFVRRTRTNKLGKRHGYIPL